jgi:hypothetical protein
MTVIQDAKPDSASRLRRAYVLGLLAAHAGTGLVLVLPAPFWLARFLATNGLAIFMSVVLSQAGLLGIWLGFTGTAFKNRLLGGTFGSVYLAVVTFCFAPASVPTAGRVFYSVFAVIPSVGVAVLLRWVRWRRKVTVVVADAYHQPGLQFSIRHLLLLTGVYALLLGLKPEVVEPTLGNSIILLAAVGLYLVCLVVGSVWASLSQGHPAPRIAIVLFLLALTSWLPAYYVGMRVRDQVLITVVSCIQVIIITGTLLVFRWLGYRVVGCRGAGFKTTEPHDSFGGAETFRRY